MGWAREWGVGSNGPIPRSDHYLGRGFVMTAAEKYVEVKCDLICANCHAEEHA